MIRPVRLFHPVLAVVLCLVLVPPALQSQQKPSPEATRLVGAMLSDTPLEEDLRELVDEIGGRPTGSKANLASVEWGLRKFREAGVNSMKESFEMPRYWQERSSRALIGAEASFSVRVVAMPFSPGTSAEGITAPLVSVGHGSAEEMDLVSKAVSGAFIFVATEPLLD
ncbi:MAG: peptidase M28, partial [Proteobacteria bacterium]|nr:peptidase M28 [Pseudomonadota bacterium]